MVIQLCSLSDFWQKCIIYWKKCCKNTKKNWLTKHLFLTNFGLSGKCWGEGGNASHLPPMGASLIYTYSEFCYIIMYFSVQSLRELEKISVLKTKEFNIYFLYFFIIFFSESILFIIILCNLYKIQIRFTHFVNFVI